MSYINNRSISKEDELITKSIFDLIVNWLKKYQPSQIMSLQKNLNINLTDKNKDYINGYDTYGFTKWLQDNWQLVAGILAAVAGGSAAGYKK